MKKQIKKVKKETKFTPSDYAFWSDAMLTIKHLQKGNKIK